MLLPPPAAGSAGAGVAGAGVAGAGSPPNGLSPASAGFSDAAGVVGLPPNGLSFASDGFASAAGSAKGSSFDAAGAAGFDPAGFDPAGSPPNGFASAGANGSLGIIRSTENIVLGTLWVLHDKSVRTDPL